MHSGDNYKANATVSSLFGSAQPRKKPINIYNGNDA